MDISDASEWGNGWYPFADYAQTAIIISHYTNWGYREVMDMEISEFFFWAQKINELVEIEQHRIASLDERPEKGF